MSMNPGLESLLAVHVGRRRVLKAGLAGMLAALPERVHNPNYSRAPLPTEIYVPSVYPAKR